MITHAAVELRSQAWHVAGVFAFAGECDVPAEVSKKVHPTNVPDTLMTHDTHDKYQS